MQVSRRNFLKFCSTSAAALGLSPATISALAQALRSPTAPTVVWLQGAGCTGCSVSFLNYVSPTPPYDVADLLINVVNLAYHPNVMGGAGSAAVKAAEDAYTAGGYVLVVEGGVPTAFGGAPCWAWTDGDIDVTFQEAVTTLAARAAVVVCVGECASFGGLWASGANPAGVQKVSQVIGRSTINVAGCPPHPSWIVYVLAEYLAGHSIPVDSYGRPTALFGSNLNVHEHCPRRDTEEASTFGQPNRCLEELGCRGPSTNANCPSQKFNNGVNWCIGAGAPCIGCTSPTYPGTSAFFRHGEGD